MEEALLKVITDIITAKKEAKIEKSYALKMEVFKVVTKTLNKLYSDGKIVVGDTLNDKWIELRG